MASPSGSNKGTSATIFTIPNESMLAVMCHLLLDLRSLRSLAMTCSNMYWLFNSFQSMFINQIIRREIGSELLPAAILIYESSRRGIRTCENNFIVRTLQTPAHLFSVSSLSQALSMNMVNASIDYLSSQLICKSLTLLSVFDDDSACFRHGKETPTIDLVADDTNPNPIPLQVSVGEWNRIRYAFYRFELFRNMFQEKFRGIKMEVYFKYFTAWENEQLACVNEFLMQALVPGFVDLVEHDVSFGNFGAEYPWDSDNLYMHHLVSLGVVQLQGFLSAKDFDSRREIYMGGREDSNPIDRTGFLDIALNDEANYPLHGNWTTLDHFDRDMKMKNVRCPVIDDGNTGPAQAWYHTHLECIIKDFVNLDGHQGIQALAYVMWDYARLLSWGIFEEPFEENVKLNDVRLYYLQYGYGYFLARHEPSARELNKTHKPRREIWDLGGRGWWSVDDMSRIEWPLMEDLEDPDSWASESRDLELMLF